MAGDVCEDVKEQQNIKGKEQMMKTIKFELPKDIEWLEFPQDVLDETNRQIEERIKQIEEQYDED